MLPSKYKRFFFVGLLLFWALQSIAQSDPSGTKKITNTYVVTNATLIPSPGTVLTNQDILIKNGLIAAVGSNLAVPAEAEEIAGDSLFVYPGFIDMGSKLGVSHPPKMEKPADFDPSNPPDWAAGIHPQNRVTNYYEPPHTNDWRKVGVTLAQKLPAGQGMLPGTTAVVAYGDSKENVIIEERSAIYAKFSSVAGMYPATSLGLMAKFRNLLENARLLHRHKTIFASHPGTPLPEKNPVLEALIPVTQRTIPLAFEASKEMDIRRILSLQREFDLAVILLGVTEGEDLIPEIKASGAGVVLSLHLPEEKPQKTDSTEKAGSDETLAKRVKEAYTTRLALAAAFEAAGVPFAFSSEQVSQDKLFQNIRLMKENGLSEKSALAAFTTHPAKLLGIDRIAGDISKGKMANMIITTDSLFAEKAQINYVFVHGQPYRYKVSQKKEEVPQHTTHWEYETTTAGGSSKGSFHITEHEGNFSGTITIDDPEQSGMKTVPLEDIKVSANTMSFSFKVSASDTELLVRVEGGVDSLIFHGKLAIVGYESFPFTAKKTEEKPI